MKVLVVEDNLDLAENIQKYLEGEGYMCEMSHSYMDAQDKIISFQYDCILLDIMLPDGNGLKLLENIKLRNLKSGVLIISAKNSLDDKINGLDEGADDYITKPFHLSELNARLKAIYRRKVLDNKEIITYKEIKVNVYEHEASVHDQKLDLTKKEFDLLLYFLTNKNRVITRQSITEHLWGDYTDNLANFDFVYQHVKNLRKKIGQAKGKDYISTVYGLGYRFNAE